MIERLLPRLRRYGPPSEAEVEALASIMTKPKSFEAGQEMIRQYSAPDESTLLLSGMVGRVVTLRSGSQQITALQIPGDFVDLHGLLLPRLDHSIVALSGCTVTTAPHLELRALIDRFPRLGRALWFLTMVDASIHRHWLTVLGRRDALSRVAHILCELYVRLEDVGLANHGRFSLWLTQAEAGDVLGLSAVHVNRVIQELRARNLIGWERREVQIKDWDALAWLAEFDPSYLQLERRTEA